MQAEYLITMSQNIDAYMKHSGLTAHKWMRIQLIIMLKLKELHPEPISLNDFIDDQNTGHQISRAVKDLKDKCDFIEVELVNNHKRGQQPKFLSLTGKGHEFLEYIIPE